MKKIFPVLYLIISVQIFSQPGHLRRNSYDDIPLRKLIYTQTLVFPGDSFYTIHFLYKVPFQNIVFHKSNGGYKGALRIDLEVTDTNSVFVKREIKDWDLKASSFTQTSTSEFSAEGLVTLKLPAGVYYLQPIITDQNSKHEFNLKTERLEIKEENHIEPVIVNSKKIICDGGELFRLANFEGNIPFGSEKHTIIIPVADISLNNINVTIISRGDTVSERTLEESFISSIDFKECSDHIVIADGNHTQTKNFILNDISGELQEGPFTIIVEEVKEKEFNSLVFWYDKPRSLNFPEIAIKALKYISEESVIDSLLDLDEEDQYRGLVDFWKKQDPSPETEYNELLTEYYERVDYAQEKFSSLTGIRGVDTDRGKIFIQFGKPDQVERASNTKGKIVETWIYIKPQRKFVFVDRQGVGEFSLESS